MERVGFSVDEGVATLTLREPPANCYSYEMMQALDAAILRARMDESAHVIVIRGEGDKFFCAGADIKMLETATPAFKYYFCLHANETLLRLEQTAKLVIAALNGHCVGGGLEVAMACDLRIGRRGKAKIGLPEVSLGVLPGTGGTQRLARMVGRAKAIEMMALGTNLSMEEAHALGLVNELVDDGDFDAQVRAYAERFLPPGKAARAVGAIKRAVISGLDTTLANGLAIERELQQQLFISDDAKEGIGAYVDKRKPNFRGK
jgi:enoyl-CoA hydratase/carnithine racemase